MVPAKVLWQGLEELTGKEMKPTPRWTAAHPRASDLGTGAGSNNQSCPCHKYDRRDRGGRPGLDRFRGTP